MAPAAIALVLLAAVAHALWNRGVHGSQDRVATLAVSGAVGCALLLPATVAQPPWSVWGLILVSGTVEAVYAGLLAAAYARGALQIAYPIGRGTAPLIVTLGAWAVLGQRPGPLALGGTAALGLGLTLVALAGGRSGQGAAVGFALATGVSIAAYSVMDAAAVRTVSPAAYLGPALGVQALALFASMACSGPHRAWQRCRAVGRGGFAVGVGVVIAYTLVLFAFRLADAGRVSTLREVSVLIAVALAGGVRSRSTWGGAGLVVVGAVAAAW